MLSWKQTALSAQSGISIERVNVRDFSSMPNPQVIWLPPCRLSAATLYVCVLSPPSPTWKRDMPWWQGTGSFWFSLHNHLEFHCRLLKVKNVKERYMGIEILSKYVNCEFAHLICPDVHLLRTQIFYCSYKSAKLITSQISHCIK